MFKFLKTSFMCMGVLFACILCASCACMTPSEVKKKPLGVGDLALSGRVLA